MLRRELLWVQAQVGEHLRQAWRVDRSGAQGPGLIKRADGLYAVDVVRGGIHGLATGAGAQFIGSR